MRSSYCISLLLTYNLTMQPENLDSLGAIRNRFQIVDRQTDLGTVLLVNLFIRRERHESRAAIAIPERHAPDKLDTFEQQYCNGMLATRFIRSPLNLFMLKFLPASPPVASIPTKFQNDIFFWSVCLSL